MFSLGLDETYVTLSPNISSKWGGIHTILFPNIFPGLYCIRDTPCISDNVLNEIQAMQA